MRRQLVLILVMTAAGLAGCTETTRYAPNSPTPAQKEKASDPSNKPGA